jgi:hypothetical protein
MLISYKTSKGKVTNIWLDKSGGVMIAEMTSAPTIA